MNALFTALIATTADGFPVAATNIPCTFDYKPAKEGADDFLNSYDQIIEQTPYMERTQLIKETNDKYLYPTKTENIIICWLPDQHDLTWPDLTALKIPLIM